MGREQVACPLLLSVQGDSVLPGRSLVTLQNSTLQCLFSPRLAAQSVSHVVPLFLDGEVSFLPQNSFPCSFQPFGVCLVIGAGAAEWAGKKDVGTGWQKGL